MKRTSCTCALVLALSVGAHVASATPTGFLRLSSTGDVIVSATQIDFTLPVGPPDGGFQQTDNALIYFNGSVTTFVPTGTLGRIKDLPAASNLAFLSYPTIPILTFDLLSLGPAPTRTDCAALNLFESCKATATSPFTLTKNGANATLVGLSALLLGHDGSAGSSFFSGAFTTQISNLNPGQIQQIIAPSGGGTPGSVTSSYSGEFTLQAIPEPGTLMTMGIGGALMMAFVIRRKSQA